MVNTPYQRLELFWQSLGMKKASAFIDTVPGLTAAALSAMKQRGSKPSAGVIRAIQLVYPALNADYVLWGTGEPTTAGHEPQPQPEQGFGHEVEVTVLRRLLAAAEVQIEKKDAKIAELNRELGKPFNGLDAASAPAPTPRTPIGFALSVSHRVKNKGAARPL